MLRKTKYCLEAGVSVLEMSVNEDFKELQSIFSTDVSRHEATCRTKNKKAVKKNF